MIYKSMKKISTTKLKKEKLRQPKKNTTQHPTGNQHQPTHSTSQITNAKETDYKKVLINHTSKKEN